MGHFFLAAASAAWPWARVDKTISKTVTHTIRVRNGENLSITGKGDVAPSAGGGTGLRIGHAVEQASVENAGTVSGGVGQPIDEQGGTGGIALDMLGVATITNTGMIVGGAGGIADAHYSDGGDGGVGVMLTAAGMIDNSFIISGGAGGYSAFGNAGAGGVGIDLAKGTVTNSDSILGGDGGNGRLYGGFGGVAVTLSSDASLTNSGSIEGGAGGTVEGSGYFTEGGFGGLGVSMSGGTLTNHGTIRGGDGGRTFYGPGAAGGAGVTITSGTLTNLGDILGGTGGGTGAGYHGGNGGAGVIMLGGTLITSGTISGGGAGTGGGGNGTVGDAVDLTGGATLILEAGFAFDGDVVASDGTELELGGTEAGTLSGLGTGFTGFTTIKENAGAIWTLTGSNTVAGTTSFVELGSLNVTGALSFLGGVKNTGSIDVSSGLVSSKQEVMGDGTIGLGAAGTLTLQDGASSGQVVNFLAGAGLLDLINPTYFGGAIAGFAGSAAIDLVNAAETSYTYSDGELIVKNGAAIVAALHFDGTYTQADFTLAGDNHGGTLITYSGDRVP
jgi:hypothetical protein